MNKHSWIFTIAVIAIITIVAAAITGPIVVYGTVSVGNVTNGEKYITLAENEDHSFSLYETINGTMTQIGGFDNFTELTDTILNQQQGQRQLEQELLQTNRAMHQLTIVLQQLIQTLQSAVAQFTIVNYAYASLGGGGSDE